MTHYKKLEVWKTSMEIVREIYQLTRNYPPEEKYGLCCQTQRAAVSMSVNIAEGVGRHYRKDTIQFLYISRGSAYELETLLAIAHTVHQINNESILSTNKKIEANIRKLNGLINYFESKT